MSASTAAVEVALTGARGVARKESRNAKSCEPEGPQDLTKRLSHVPRRRVN
jgi:hypothetical protein